MRGFLNVYHGFGVFEISHVLYMIFNYLAIKMEQTIKLQQLLRVIEKLFQMKDMQIFDQKYFTYLLETFVRVIEKYLAFQTDYFVFKAAAKF